MGTSIIRYNPFIEYEVDLSTRPKLLPNQQIGNLTLIKRNPFKYNWTCKCLLCKKTREIDEALLLTGLITSCGCDGPLVKVPEPESPPEEADDSNDISLEQN